MSRRLTIDRPSAYNIQQAAKFTEYRQNSKFTDCQIIVGDDTIECHANIISACSPVIERMLESKWKEGVERKVKFKTIDPGVMRIVIGYCYTGNVAIDKADLRSVVEACDYLEILKLRDTILEKVTPLSGLLTSDNAIGWMRLAGLLQQEDFACMCRNFISASFKKVIKEEEFMDMSLDELKVCLQDASDMNIASEDLLHAVFTWITFDKAKRAVTLDTALQVVNLEDCPRSVIKQILGQYENILDTNTAFYKKITNILLERSSSPIQSKHTPVMSLIVTGGAANNVCWKLYGKEQFTKIIEMPEDVYTPLNCVYHSICVYEGVGLIVTGGHPNAICSVYHAAAKVWKPLADMSFPRRSYASVCICGELFIIGNYVPDEGSSASVEVLNVNEDNGKWRLAPPVPKAFCMPKVACLTTRMYCMGFQIRQFYCFDTVQKNWNELAAIPQDIGFGFSVAAGNGMIYAAGGSKDICFIYDTNTDNWTQAHGPALKHQHAALVFHNDKFMLLGGQCAAIEEYDAEEDTWNMAPCKLPMNLQQHYAFSMDFPG